MQTFSRDADVLKAVWQDGGNCDGQFYGFFVVGNIGQCNCKLKQTWKETCDSRTGQSGW